jgi:hypothetical protein
MLNLSQKEGEPKSRPVRQEEIGQVDRKNKLRFGNDR